MAVWGLGLGLGSTFSVKDGDKSLERNSFVAAQLCWRYLPEKLQQQLDQCLRPFDE